MESALGDVRISLRQLARSPGFTAAAVTVLALGIGLNAAMFNLVYALGIAGRPYRDPATLMQLYSSRTSEPDSYRAFSYPAYRELAQSDLFAGLLAHSPTIVGVNDGGGDSRRAFAVMVSQNYFDVLGVPVIHGRGFTFEETLPGRDIPVAIATYGYWQRTGFDPALVGRTIRMNERAYTVIGITPRGFTGTMTAFGPEWFFPLGVFHSLSDDFDGEQRRTLERADAYNLFLVARLKEAASAEATAARLTGVGGGLAREFPAEYQDARVTMAPLPRFGTSTSPSSEGVLGVLSAVMMGLTGAVLLTVCLNLASMLLARGRARRKELAIRLALGSGRARIIRQLLTEGFLLAAAGGAIGVALGLAAIDAVVNAFATMIPVAIVLEGTASPALVAVTLLLCVLATVWFALGPALRHSRADVIADLKPQAGEDARERRGWFVPRHPLLVAQVALSLALLIAAGLFVRMAQSALLDLGFDADATVLAEVDSRLGGYDTTQALDLYARVERRLAALPGVHFASVGALVPLGMIGIDKDVRRAGINVPPGATPQSPEQGQAFDTPWNAVSGAYFAAMGVPLLRGRTFSDTESFTAGSRPVAIIDEALARRLWPEGDALGQQIQFAERDVPAERAIVYEVIGIVGSTRRDLFEEEMPGGVYVPFAQGAMGNAFFHVRPAARRADLVDLVRSEVRDAAPGLPLFGARTFAAHIDAAPGYWALGLSSALFGAFGGFAMVVALVGIYGVMSYAVVRRTREIGIRLAVGATTHRVRGMILKESLGLTILGIALGWVLGIGVGRILAGIFVDVEAFDGLTFALVPAAFLAAGFAAAWLPARRATRVNPLAALRAE